MAINVQKRIAVGALIFNKQNQFLIVKPTYRDHWLLVGGAVEPGENLTEALKREIREETGLNIDVGRLVCVDYGRAENRLIHFTFECGFVENNVEITCPPSEIADYQFVSKAEGLQMLGPKGVRRLGPSLDALATNTTVFLET